MSMLKRRCLLGAFVAILVSSLSAIPAQAELIARYIFNADIDGTTPCVVSDNYATLGPRVRINTTPGLARVGTGVLEMKGPGDPAGPGQGAATNNTFAWPNDARTITFWWRALSPNVDTSGGTYISMGTNAANGTRFDVRESGSSVSLRVEIQGVENSQTNPAIDDGEWHFIAMVVPDDATLGTVKWYVNGSTDNLNTSTSTAAINTGTGPLVMGASIVTLQTSRAPYGYLDDVRLYNTALSLDEIQKIYLQAKARNPIPGHEDVVDLYEWKRQFTWDGPLTRFDPDGEPNLVSVDSFDIVYYEKATEDVTDDDPNWLLGRKVTGVTSPYTYPYTVGHDRTFFWRVDTHVTWDSNDFTGTSELTETVTGLNWQFRCTIDNDMYDATAIGDAGVLTFVDVNNTRVFVKVHGADAVAWFTGDNIHFNRYSGTIWVTGENLRLDAITLNETHIGTQLLLDTSGGSGRSSIGSIDADGPMDSIRGEKIDLRGTVQTLGGTSSISLGDVIGPCTIVVGPPASAGQSMALTFKRVNDLWIISETPIRSITAEEWIDSPNIEDIIAASTGIDLTAFASIWLADDCGMYNDWCDGADLNQDGQVDFLDFLYMAYRFAQ